MNYNRRGWSKFGNHRWSIFGCHFHACLIATTLHDLTKDEQRSVLAEVARTLVEDGELNIIEFRKIDLGPGPPVEIRMEEENVDVLVASQGFEKIGRADVGDYNYLTRYRKKA